MGIKDEGRNAQRQHREPEIDQMWDEHRECSVKQQEEVSHAHVDTWACETRIEDAELNASRGKAASRRNVPGTSEAEVAEN